MITCQNLFDCDQQTPHLQLPEHSAHLHESHVYMAHIYKAHLWGPGSVVRMFLCAFLLNCMVSGAMGQMTAEVLIGQAVSLSNQSYPDVENAIQRFRNGDVQGARVFLEKAKVKHAKLPPPDVTLAKMQAFARNALAMRR